MSWIDGWRERLRSRLRRQATERELDDELAFHLEQEVAKNIAAGMTQADARRAARVSFGAAAQYREEVRDVWSGLPGRLAADVRQGIRRLRRQPGFALVAALTLGLGIGANTAIFSIVHGVLLKPLPYADPDRLVVLWNRSGDLADDSWTSAREVLEYRRATTTLSHVAAYSDVFVSLAPENEWTTSRTKEELVAAMAEALEHRVPGMGFSFTQPIEMRFNELIAGVRSDVAVSVFGDDLDVLQRLGGEVAAMLRRVPGAADVRAEQVQGLPVLRIVLDRARAARYGIPVDDVLGAVEAIRAGRVVGVVMDGVRRYDIVVKFALPLQADLEAIRNLPVLDSDGHAVPLAQLAEIAIEEGPAQISREFGQRRLIVEANVRGRDLASFVAEARGLVDASLDKPEGYYLEWGGTFEQLERGRERLLLVVPIALFAIFGLLYAAFGSVRGALLIFTGVPLAAVGGVLALWTRGIPFSISAGVGFIALFGVAVLNGVVMVSAIRRLRDEGLGLQEAVERGALERLRPVLMTALVASLGFVPMALSTSAGAEVQRPLATVVIGGLISSTLLTLVVLPTLYAWVGDRRSRVSATDARA